MSSPKTAANEPICAKGRRSGGQRSLTVERLRKLAGRFKVHPDYCPNVWLGHSRNRRILIILH